MGALILLFTILPLHAIRDVTKNSVLRHESGADWAEMLGRLNQDLASTQCGNWKAEVGDDSGKVEIRDGDTTYWSWRDAQVSVSEYIEMQKTTLTQETEKLEVLQQEMTVLKVEVDSKTKEKPPLPVAKFQGLVHELCDKYEVEGNPVIPGNKCFYLKCGKDGKELKDSRQQLTGNFIKEFDERRLPFLEKLKGTYTMTQLEKLDDNEQPPSQIDQCMLAIGGGEETHGHIDENQEIDMGFCKELCRLVAGKMMRMRERPSSGRRTLELKYRSVFEKVEESKQLIASIETDIEGCEAIEKEIGVYVKELAVQYEEYQERIRLREKAQLSHVVITETIKTTTEQWEIFVQEKEEVRGQLEDKGGQWKEIEITIRTCKAEIDALEANIEKTREGAEDTKKDIRRLEDAKVHVTNFKLKLAEILIHINGLYDAVINNPVRTLLGSAESIKEKFSSSQKTEFIRGNNGLIETLQMSIENLVSQCDTTFRQSFAKVEFKNSEFRLMLPSESLGVNTSKVNSSVEAFEGFQTTQDHLLSNMPGVKNAEISTTYDDHMVFGDVENGKIVGFLEPDEIKDLPGCDEFAPEDQQTLCKVLNGLPDVCDALQIQMSRQTTEKPNTFILQQITSEVEMRGAYLQTNFIKIHDSVLKNQIVDREGKTEARLRMGEPDGLQRFEKIFGDNLAFYRNYLKMWSMDGDVLPYFLRLEAQLHYLVLVARAHLRDAKAQIAKLNEDIAHLKGTVEIMTKKLRELEKEIDKLTEEDQKLYQKIVEIKHTIDEQIIQKETIISEFDYRNKLVGEQLKLLEGTWERGSYGEFWADEDRTMNNLDYNYDLYDHRSSLLDAAIKTHLEGERARRQQNAGMSSTALRLKEEAIRLQKELQKMQNYAVYPPPWSL